MIQESKLFEQKMQALGSMDLDHLKTDTPDYSNCQRGKLISNTTDDKILD